MDPVEWRSLAICGIEGTKVPETKTDQSSDQSSQTRYVMLDGRTRH